jgi:hypothetical protein
MEKIMKHHHVNDDDSSFNDYEFESARPDSAEEINHKKQVRRMLEDRLEKKRLRLELQDDLDDEFDWSDYEK